MIGHWGCSPADLREGVGPRGEEQRKFIVPVEYLNHPLFVRLLKESEEEYGFEQQGAITLPCRVEDFQHIQDVIDHEFGAIADDEHQPPSPASTPLEKSLPSLIHCLATLCILLGESASSSIHRHGDRTARLLLPLFSHSRSPQQIQGNRPASGYSTVAAASSTAKSERGGGHRRCRRTLPPDLKKMRAGNVPDAIATLFRWIDKSTTNLYCRPCYVRRLDRHRRLRIGKASSPAAISASPLSPPQVPPARSIREKEIQMPEGLTLYANGCGFHGNPATNNLC